MTEKEKEPKVEVNEKPEQPPPQSAPTMIVRGVQLVELDNGLLAVRPLGEFNSVYEFHGWLDGLWPNSQRVKEVHAQQQRRDKQ